MLSISITVIALTNLQRSYPHPQKIKRKKEYEIPKQEIIGMEIYSFPVLEFHTLSEEHHL